MMDRQCAACPHPEHDHRVCNAAWDERNRCECTEWRPGYILAARAQALDSVQEIIEQLEGDYDFDQYMPGPDEWERLKSAAFPPPPMAGGA